MTTIIAGHPVPYSLTVQGLHSRAAITRAAQAYLAVHHPGAVITAVEAPYVWYALPMPPELEPLNKERS